MYPAARPHLRDEAQEEGVVLMGEHVPPTIKVASATLAVPTGPSGRIGERDGDVRARVLIQKR